MENNVILIALIPALGWGLMPILAKVIGGRPIEQLIGTTVAALSFGLIFSSVSNVKYVFASSLICLLSGLFWAVGQYYQFRALENEDVSKVMPISTGTQILFTTLVSGILLEEWRNWKLMIFSILALILIQISILLITANKKKGRISRNVIFYLIVSSLSLTGYVSITAFFQISGPQVFMPQALGMFLGGAFISISKIKNIRLCKILSNSITGAAWTGANFSLFYVSPMIGVGLSYVLSQLCLVVSIIGGIVFLKEKKTIRSKWMIGLGTGLYLLGTLLMGVKK